MLEVHRLELAEGMLDPEDQVHRWCRGQLDEKFGYIVLSNRKLLFVEEKESLTKTYNFYLEIPYEKIDKIAFERKLFQLVVTESNGEKHYITTEDPLKVGIYLRELMQPVLPRILA